MILELSATSEGAGDINKGRKNGLPKKKDGTGADIVAGQNDALAQMARGLAEGLAFFFARGDAKTDRQGQGQAEQEQRRGTGRAGQGQTWGRGGLAAWGPGRAHPHATGFMPKSAGIKLIRFCAKAGRIAGVACMYVCMYPVRAAQLGARGREREKDPTQVPTGRWTGSMHPSLISYLV